MFERFTDRARRVLVVAQDAAREMGHQRITPEHILVALTEGHGIAAKAMAQCGVDRAAVRARVAALYESEPLAQKLDKIPFSSGAKRALEQSLRAALKLGHKYIGTEHLYLGVQREAEQRRETLDELLGVSAAAVNDRVMQIVADWVRPGASGRPAPPGDWECSPALQSAMNAATRAVGQDPVTTGHLLAAMVADTDSQAARALAVLGLSEEAVGGALTQVPLAGTSDATPSGASIAITTGGTTTLITDPEVVAALHRFNVDQLREIIKKAIGSAGSDQAAG